MDKKYEVIFWKVIERIIKRKSALLTLVEEIKMKFMEKREYDFFTKVGKLIIEMNHLNTAFEGIERLFPELFKDNAKYKQFKKKYEKLMQLIIQGYEKRNMVELQQYVEIIRESYLKESYVYLQVAFRKEGAYVL
jgi:hypothetical protein